MPDPAFYAAALIDRIEARGVNVDVPAQDLIFGYATTLHAELEEHWDGASGKAVRAGIDDYAWLPAVTARQVFEFFLMMGAKSERLRQAELASALSQHRDEVARLEEGGNDLGVLEQLAATITAVGPTGLCFSDPGP